MKIWAQGDTGEYVRTELPIMNLGDENPYEYWGYFIYADNSAVYWDEPEGKREYNEEKDDWDHLEVYTVYRFTIDDDPFTDMRWVKDDTWESIKDSMGEYKDMSLDEWKAEIKADLRSRAMTYWDVGMHWGFDNLDGYPEKCTYEDMQRLYPYKGR